MTIELDPFEIAYKNRCREDKVIEAIEAFRKPLNDIFIKVEMT
jgi:hypothetical protein